MKFVGMLLIIIGIILIYFIGVKNYSWSQIGEMLRSL